MTVSLSPTAFLTYEDCPRQYHYRYVLKVKSAVTPANLVFGDVVHRVLERYLRDWLKGHPVEPAAAFETLWRQRIQTEVLDFPAQWSPEALLATGQRLVEQFPAIWDAAGLMPLLDKHGEPLLERRLQAPLVKGITLSGKLDCVALDRDARVMLLDFKTPAQATDPLFARQSEQLTAYQWLLAQNAAALGIEGVDGLGFLELIKRKVPSNGRGKGPQVHPPVIVAPRDAATLGHLRTKLVGIAEDIRRQRFPRRPRMAHNTPCALCDYRHHCVHGDPEGLIFPEAV